MDEWIANGKLEVPPHLKDSLYSFLKLMVGERAQEDELLFEYNRAICPLLQYDLFKADATINRKEKQAMKEKGIKVKVVFTEGYQKRFTEAFCRVLEERERGQELARMVQDLKDNGKGEVG